MKSSLAVTIAFCVVAVACLVLGCTVVPEPQRFQVLSMGAFSGGIAALSAQIWKLHKKIAELQSQRDRAERHDQPNA